MKSSSRNQNRYPHIRLYCRGSIAISAIDRTGQILNLIYVDVRTMIKEWVVWLPPLCRKALTIDRVVEYQKSAFEPKPSTLYGHWPMSRSYKARSNYWATVPAEHSVKVPSEDLQRPAQDSHQRQLHARSDLVRSKTVTSNPRRTARGVQSFCWAVRFSVSTKISAEQNPEAIRLVTWCCWARGSRPRTCHGRFQVRPRQLVSAHFRSFPPASAQELQSLRVPE